jgi:hypothetical protein
MASFEEQFYLENPSRWQAWCRDVRLLLWLARRALLWLTRGVLVRWAYRRAQARGEPLVLEDILRD